MTPLFDHVEVEVDVQTPNGVQLEVPTLKRPELCYSPEIKNDTH